MKLEFWAGARTQAGGEIVLLVEPLRGVEGNASFGANQLEVGIVAPAEGSSGRNVSVEGTSVTVRWRDSGWLRGILRFMLRATTPGTYRAPLRFVLTAP